MAQRISDLDRAPIHATSARRRWWSFFVAISVAVLAIVVLGFSRTLYLRPLFDVPPIPAYLYVHGAVLTAWFSLVVVQTTLIRRRSVATHRRLGVAALFLGAAVVVVSAMVTLRFADRVLHAPTPADVRMSVLEGLGADTPLTGLAATALWGNGTFLLLFISLVTTAVLLRARSDVHKRLMILASLSILAPAIARISRWPGLGGDLGPLVPIVMLSLLGAMVAFDLRTRRRVHPATWVGGGLVIICVVAGALIGQSSFGLRSVAHLG